MEKRFQRYSKKSYTNNTSDKLRRRTSKKLLGYYLKEKVYFGKHEL